MNKEQLNHCILCPRHCGADRYSDKLGYCKTDAGFHIGSVTVHKGEEPVISGKMGICNIFFSRCNLQCIYCQNYQISRNKGKIIDYNYSLNDLTEKIISVLDTGVRIVGFVSPSHCIAQMKMIINALRQRGKRPVIVMNTNAYDNSETLHILEGMIDIYLPDFKYMDSRLSKNYSDVSDYPDIALKAIREMYRQKGSILRYDDEGQAESGLIIRHLILPGHVENSLAVLRAIAEELSTSVHISLMSQYYPPEPVKDHHVIGRRLNKDEYKRVVNEMESLGFYNGWIQELESSSSYVPDFVKEHPFE